MLRLVKNEGVWGMHSAIQPCLETLGTHWHSAALSGWKHLFALNEIFA